MSTIFATRTGFHYQDKLAVYLFLTHFRDKDITAFYADYPIAAQKSLDVRLLTKKEQFEKIYEIKTGHTFKSVENEISGSILDLYAYSLVSQDAILHLYINHGFLPAISHYWDTLIVLKEYKILNSTRAQEAAKWLLGKLNAEKIIFPNEASVHAFCGKFLLDDFPADCNTRKSQTDPHLEKLIMREIDLLVEELGADSTGYEYPNEILFHNMMYHFARMAGTGENLLPVIQNCFVEYITMRKLFSEHYPRPSAIEQKKAEVKKKVEKDFNNWWNGKKISLGNESQTGE